MGDWLHCEACDGRFKKQSQKVYAIHIEELKFVEDGQYKNTKNDRHIQFCEECIKNSLVGLILKKENREF